MIGDVRPRERQESCSCRFWFSAREDDNRKLPPGLRLNGPERRVRDQQSGPQLGAATRASGLRMGVPALSADLKLNLRIGLEVEPPRRRAWRAATSGHNDQLVIEALVTARGFGAPVRYADPWCSAAAPDGPRCCRPTVQPSASKATRAHDSGAPESRGARSPTSRACHSSAVGNSPSDRLYPVYVMQASARHLVLGRSPQLQGEKAHQARFRPPRMAGRQSPFSSRGNTRRRSSRSPALRGTRAYPPPPFRSSTDGRGSASTASRRQTPRQRRRTPALDGAR